MQHKNCTPDIIHICNRYSHLGYPTKKEEEPKKVKTFLWLLETKRDFRLGATRGFPQPRLLWWRGH